MLLLVFDSVQVHATETLLVSGEAVLAATLTVKVTVEVPEVAAIVLVVVHVITCPFGVQADHPVPALLTNVKPAGSVSVTVIVPLLAPAPELVTVIGIVSAVSFTVKLVGL